MPYSNFIHFGTMADLGAGAPRRRPTTCGKCRTRRGEGGACLWCAAFLLFEQCVAAFGRSLPAEPRACRDRGRPFDVAFDERPAASFFALLNRGLKRRKPAARAWFLEWFAWWNDPEYLEQVRHSDFDHLRQRIAPPNIQNLPDSHYAFAFITWCGLISWIDNTYGGSLDRSERRRGAGRAPYTYVVALLAQCEDRAEAEAEARAMEDPFFTLGNPNPPLVWFGADFDFDDFSHDNEASVLDDEPGDYAYGFYDNH